MMRGMIAGILEAAVAATIGNLVLAAIGRALSAPPETFGPYMYGTVAALTGAAAVSYYFFEIPPVGTGPMKP